MFGAGIPVLLGILLGFGFGHLEYAHSFLQFVDGNTCFARLLFHSPYMFAHPSGCFFALSIACVCGHSVNSILCSCVSLARKINLERFCIAPIQCASNERFPGRISLFPKRSSPGKARNPIQESLSYLFSSSRPRGLSIFLGG